MDITTNPRHGSYQLRKERPGRNHNRVAARETVRIYEGLVKHNLKRMTRSRYPLVMGEIGR